MVTLTRKQRAGLERLRKTYAVRFVIVFGSAVTDRVHTGSDLDIAVFFAPQASAGEERFPYPSLDLMGDLQELFPEQEVDLVVLNGADPLLLKQVTAKCRFLAGDYSAFQQFCTYAFQRYEDYRLYLNREGDAVTRHVRQL